MRELFWFYFADVGDFIVGILQYINDGNWNIHPYLLPYQTALAILAAKFTNRLVLISVPSL